MAVLIIVLVAVALAGLSTAFTLYETRLARRTGVAPEVVVRAEALPLDLVPTVASGIFSRRARCGCGDAFENHEQGPCADCTCGRFRYAGGLVARAS